MRRRAALSLIVTVSILLAAASSAWAGPVPDLPTMEDRLEQLGGRPCPDEPRLTCVTLSVPLDHFNPSDSRTLDVVFGVLPASGTSKGLFVIATGGPGSAGIAEYDLWVPYFDSSIRRRFDIVFFDQRGIGLSGGLTCPNAAAEYYSSALPPIDAASAFSDACVSEMGSASLLPFVDTTQAVEDLHAFREAVGRPQMWLYGVSYGTQYAQTYAAAHGDALEGLVIDGVVDLTLSGPDFWVDAAGAFEGVLDDTLASCQQRPRCRADARVSGSTSVEDVYDRLAARLPEPVRFPLPAGGTEVRQLTSADLVTVAAGQVYTEDDRMMLQRAVAAAGRDDLVPLLRLAYVNFVVDPQTLEAIPDPSYSDGMYYGVDCRDYGYYTGTPEERAAQFLGSRHEPVPAVPSLVVGARPGRSPGRRVSGPRPVAVRPVSAMAQAVLDPALPRFRLAGFGRLGGWVALGGSRPRPSAWSASVYHDCPDELVTRFLVAGRRRMRASRPARVDWRTRTCRSPARTIRTGTGSSSTSPSPAGSTDVSGT